MSKSFKRQIETIKVLLDYLGETERRYTPILKHFYENDLSISQFKNALDYCLGEKYIKRVRRGIYMTTEKGHKFNAGLKSSSNDGE